MRLRIALGFSFAALSSLFGCQAILGTFTTEGGSGTDGGADVTADVNGDGASDGGADVTPPPKVMSCAVDGSPHPIVQNADFTDQFIALHVLATSGKDRRVGMTVQPQNPQGPRQLIFYDVPEGLNGNTPRLSGFPINTETLAAGSYDGGFVALGWQSSNQMLSGYVFADTATAPSTAVSIPTVPAIPNGAGDWSVAVAPIDPVNSIFFAAFAFRGNSGPWGLYAGAVNLGSGAPLPPLKEVHSFATRPNVDSHAILIDRAGKRAALLLQPDQGVGKTQIFTVDYKNQIDLGLRPFSDGNGAEVISVVAGPSVPDPGTNGLAVLEGDLNNTSIPFGMRVTTIDDSNVGAFAIKDFPALIPFGGPGDIVVDKSYPEWRFFPGGPQLVMAGRKTLSGAGVNLLWLDSKGFLRAQATGASTLVPLEKVRSASATFRQQPTALFANVVIAWINETNKLMMADVACAP